MPFKVTIEKIIPATDPSKYDKAEKVYEQVFDAMNVANVIKAANGFPMNGEAK